MLLRSAPYYDRQRWDWDLCRDLLLLGQLQPYEYLGQSLHTSPLAAHHASISRLGITGLDCHYPFSEHPHAARKKIVGREAVLGEHPVPHVLGEEKACMLITTPPGKTSAS